MVQKKDKKAVVGEVFDDERIRGFLLGDAPHGVDRDFHLLERAYRGMLADNFETFVGYFVAEGHAIDAQNPQGKTMLELVSEHSCSEDYVTAITGPFLIVVQRRHSKA